MNPSASQHGTHYSVAELGPIEAWKGYTAEVAALPGIKVPGKFFCTQRWA